MSGELLLINPRKRKTKAKRATPRKRRASARRTTRRAAPVVVMSNPSPRRRRSRLHAIKTKARRVSRKYRRNPLPKFSVNAITGMAKNAAIGAAGALAVDLAYGYAKGMLPANMQTPVAADGTLNPLYYVAKAALAVGVGVFGSKVTKHATDMAAGSLTVQAYEVMRTFVPLTVNLGYVSPARVVGTPKRAAGGRIGMNQFVSGYTPPVGNKYMGEFVS